MDGNNNIKEFLNKNDILIYSFFKSNLGETVYIGIEQYLIYRYIAQFTSEKWYLIGKTKFDETKHIIIVVTTIITNNKHNYSVDPEEEKYIKEIMCKILLYKKSMDQINNYFS